MINFYKDISHPFGDAKVLSIGNLYESGRVFPQIFCAWTKEENIW